MFVLILLHHKGVVLILEQSALIVEVLAICLFNVLQKLVAKLEKDSPSLEAIKGSKQLKIQEEICEPLNVRK